MNMCFIFFKRTNVWYVFVRLQQQILRQHWRISSSIVHTNNARNHTTTHRWAPRIDNSIWFNKARTECKLLWKIALVVAFFRAMRLFRCQHKEIPQHDERTKFLDRIVGQKMYYDQKNPHCVWCMNPEPIEWTIFWLNFPGRLFDGTSFHEKEEFPNRRPTNFIIGLFYCDENE